MLVICLRNNSKTNGMKHRKKEEENGRRSEYSKSPDHEGLIDHGLNFGFYFKCYVNHWQF